jgi:hypothetical protein
MVVVVPTADVFAAADETDASVDVEVVLEIVELD